MEAKVKDSQFEVDLNPKTPRTRKNLGQNPGNINALYATRRGL